jgi:hypothetical protein
MKEKAMEDLEERIDAFCESLRDVVRDIADKAYQAGRSDAASDNVIRIIKKAMRKIEEEIGEEPCQATTH